MASSIFFVPKEGYEVNKNPHEGYIEAWRVWKVFLDEPRIESLFFRTTWIPGEKFVAKCSGQSAAPCLTHACGIYASLDEQQSLEWFANGKASFAFTYVFGRVGLWGKVITHERGYRGQYAYPLGFHGCQIAKVKQDEVGQIVVPDITPKEVISLLENLYLSS